MNDTESEEEIRMLLQQIEKKVSRFGLELKNNKYRAKEEIEQLIEVTSLEIETFCLEYEDGNENGPKTLDFKRQLDKYRENIENIFREYRRKNDEQKLAKSSQKRKMKDMQSKLQTFIL